MDDENTSPLNYGFVDGAQAYTGYFTDVICYAGIPTDDEKTGLQNFMLDEYGASF